LGGGPNVNKTGETQTSGLTVTIHWIPRNKRHLTMSGWSARFPKQARPTPATRKTTPAFRTRSRHVCLMMAPLSESPVLGQALYYEQAQEQLKNLAKPGVFELPIRLVGLSEPRGKIVSCLFNTYSDPRYSRALSSAEPKQCLVDGTGARAGLRFV